MSVSNRVGGLARRAVLSGAAPALLALSAFAGPIDHVLVVSLDGARPGDLQSVAATNLQAMAAVGAVSWTAQTIDPSVTLIAHASMLTGCQPAKHGVDWNDYQPTNYVKTNTCFEAVKASGRGAAMVASKSKLVSIAKPGTVDAFIVNKQAAEQVAAEAAAYFEANRPALLFVHFSDPDIAGHSTGWGSPEYLDSLLACDRGVALLRAAVAEAGAASRAVFLVTADHGGHGTGHGTTDPLDMTIPWIAYGPGNVEQGSLTNPVSVCDTAATAVSALGLPVDPGWDGQVPCVLHLDPGPADAAAMAITANPEAVRAGGSSAIRVQLKDAYGNNLTNTGANAVSLSASLGALGAITTNADGTFEAELSAGMEPGLAEIRGVLNGLEMEARAYVQIEAGPPQPVSNIDPVYRFAWSENAGWQNWRSPGGGVTVVRDGADGYLSGYAWCENLGWLKLGSGGGPYANTGAGDYGVNLDAAGNLSGYAWSETTGWIGFSNAYGQVTLLGNAFDGYAWSENAGWIHFKNDAPGYAVRLRPSGGILHFY